MTAVQEKEEAVQKAASPQNGSFSMPTFPSRLSNLLFRIFFFYMILVFAGYAAYFLYAVFASAAPGLSAGVSGLLNALPEALSSLLSSAAAYHLVIAVFLAFLNFTADLFRFPLSKFSFSSVSGLTKAAFVEPLFWTALVFLGTALFGYIAGLFYPEIFETLFLFGGFPEGESTEMMLFIFLNNARIVFTVLFLGFVFGLLPLLILLVNGFAVGLVSQYTVQSEGILFLLAGILPHGLIELPVILGSVAVGGHLAATLISVLKKHTAFEVFQKEFIATARFFFFIAVPLLLTAAFLEVYVTAPLLNIVF